MKIEEKVKIPNSRIIHNPSHRFFKDFLMPYYVKTADNQYLFASKQPGRRPDRAFYMVPGDYKLGKGQKRFNKKKGKRIYRIALDYLKNSEVVVQEGVQGESGYETGLRVTTSIENPHSAYMPWMGKMMIFPKKDDMNINCLNYIIPEKLPEKYIEEIKSFWPEYDPNIPLTLYDLTDMENDRRRVLNLGVDYFGGAYKKPNLTMVWNRAESDGLISYHAGCTKNRVLKGLSGTGKTTLTVGQDLYQDDAVLGKPVKEDGKITESKLIGLEAASYAKSESLEKESPEWPGLMRSRDGSSIVLAQNIDCEGVKYITDEIAGYKVRVPKKTAKGKVGHLQCNKYEKSGTKNGRFIFKFSELNPDWKAGVEKSLKTVAINYRRYHIIEPIIRVKDPEMAVALDSACESIITSAVGGKEAGKKVRSYAATDFMAREQSQQAKLKLKMYKDLGLGFKGKLVFLINNTGWVGRRDLEGKKLDQGEKIEVKDSKKLLSLLENREIGEWIEHPVYGYLIPDTKELEEEHGMSEFSDRFNPLNYYSSEKYLKFIKRDIKERTEFLKNLFGGQKSEKELKGVINTWENCELPKKEEIEHFYETHY